MRPRHDGFSGLRHPGPVHYAHNNLHAYVSTSDRYPHCDGDSDSCTANRDAHAEPHTHTRSADCDSHADKYTNCDPYSDRYPYAYPDSRQSRPLRAYLAS